MAVLDLMSGFIVELRNAGLPVSLTENLDAMEAVKEIPLEDREGRAHVEPAPLLLRLRHDEGLERGEVVGQPGQGRRQRADELQLADHVVDRHRQLRGREDLLADRRERLLRRHARDHPLRERPEQVGLFDVLLAFEHGAFRTAEGPGKPIGPGRHRRSRL